jgi:uncharacterized protein (TIGR03437 family)
MVLLAAPALRAQTLTASQTSLTFTSPVDGPPTSLAVNVTSSPSAAVILATAVEQSDPSVVWLSASASSGITPTTVAVTVNPSALDVGTYTGSVVISVFGGPSSVTVGVTLTVSSINVAPTSLSFQSAQGGTPLVQSVTLSAGQPMTFTTAVSTTNGGNWLDVSPASGLISGFSAISAIPDATIVPTLGGGVYSATITITPTSGASLAPVIIPVTLTITAPPAVTANPASVNLQYQINGTNNTPQTTVNLTETGAQQVAFTATATNQVTPVGGTWVTVSPASGQITASGTPLTVGYNPLTNLASGTWLGSVTVSTPGGSPTSTNIPVSLTISALPLLNVPATSLNFTASLNATTPPAQTVNITSTSATAQIYNVSATTTDGSSWLIVPATGTTPGPLSISVNPSGLVPGTYSGNVTVTGQGTGNGAQQIPVTMTVSNVSALVANFGSLNLAYQIGQTSAVSQIVSLSSSNGAPLTFGATTTTSSCGATWLALSTTTGTTPGLVTATINSQGLTAGTCAGTISIVASNALTGAAAINSPLVIPVTLTVSTTSVLNVAPLNPAVFTTQAGGSVPATQIYQLLSSDSNQLNFTVASSTVNGGSGWLNPSLTNGNTSSGFNKLGISVIPGSLPAGTYTGTVTIAATLPNGAAVANSPVTLPVTFNVTTGSLILSPGILTFNQSAGGAAPGNQEVNITSSGTPLGFAATVYAARSSNWLTVSPSGTTPGTITVGANGNGLAQGTYNGLVTIVSTTANSGNSPVLLPVTLVINAGTISVTPASMTFTQVQGGPAPTAQSLAVAGFPAAISYQVSANAGSGTWLAATPANGFTSSTVQVSVAQNNLAVGSYSGAVTLTAPGALGSPIIVPVTLNVVTPHPLSATPTLMTFTVQPGSTSAQTGQVQVNSATGSTTYNLTVVGGTWLSASPTGGTTPDTISVYANPAGLATGAYSGSLIFTSQNAVGTVTVTVNLVVGKPAPPVLSAVANAASYSTGSIAPGENVVIFGSGIGPQTLIGGTLTNGVVDTSVGATRVLFNGIPGPLLYALTTQTSAMAPYEISGVSTVTVVVEYQGVQSAPIVYSAALAEPGIYAQSSQGVGPGAILNQDYSVNTAARPAPKGSVVSVYMSGDGFTVGAVDGAIATGVLSPVLPVTATVGGVPATVYYAGTSPGIITGATQVNVLIPSNAPSGSAVPLVITVGTGASAVSTQSGITISVQ